MRTEERTLYKRTGGEVIYEHDNGEKSRIRMSQEGLGCVATLTPELSKEAIK
jgi:hypothetical protein